VYHSCWTFEEPRPGARASAKSLDNNEKDLYQ
jgi:hypothetical protein